VRVSSPPDKVRPKLDGPRPDELGKVVDRLLDLMLTLVASLGLVVVLASLNRWIQKGWHPQPLAHLGVYLVLLLAYLFRKRVSRRVRVAALIVPLWANGAANLAFQGIAGTGMLFLSTASILAVVLFGLRAALATLAASTAVIAAVTIVSPHASVTESLARGSAFVGLVTGCVLVLNAVHKTLRQHMEDLEREVAERQRVEGQLSEREHKYRLLADNSRDLVVTFDMKGEVSYASPACETMFGYTPEEMVGRHFSEMLAAGSRERACADFQKYTGNPAPEKGALPLFEYECRRKDGTTFWGELRASRAGGNVIQGVLRDISDRRAAEARRIELENQLQQAERLKAIGQLAGGIAHDFNNQLAGIMGYAELLKVNRPEDSLVQTYADGVLSPARRAADLTGKLLAFARRGQYRREKVDLHAIVREVISLLQRSIDKSITVVEALTAARSTVVGDPTLLQSAVLNVALNARDAMPNGGTLKLLTEQDGPSGIRLQVMDTGHGMDTETLRRAFEPFFTTKSVGRGTGMGLPAVQGTVQQHDGTIELESAPGQGTTVSIRLPLADTEGVAPSTNPGVVVGGKGHVMLVEDEHTVREMMERALRLLGYKVTICLDGPEAIETYRGCVPAVDLVLLDMILPAMRGIEVFRALRKHNPQAKILIFSGYSADDDAREILSLGALGFIQKPVSLTDLSARLAEAMAKK
jgi:PAS domain S-box-containing protein